MDEDKMNEKVQPEEDNHSLKEEKEFAEWQPIETAPFDTEVLVLTNNSHFVASANKTEFPEIFKTGHEWNVWDGRHWHDLRGGYPTHWMPLPEPPK